MAKKLTDAELENVVIKFTKPLLGKISLDRILLYGSYAKGSAHVKANNQELL